MIKNKSFALYQNLLIKKCYQNTTVDYGERNYKS